MTNLDMRGMPDHHPQRGDQVEAWIKDRRDRYDDKDSETMWAYQALDDLLDEYRLAADMGQTLEEIVNPEATVTRPLGQKKKAKE